MGALTLDSWVLYGGHGGHSPVAISYYTTATVFSVAARTEWPGIERICNDSCGKRWEMGPAYVSLVPRSDGHLLRARAGPFWRAGGLGNLFELILPHTISGSSRTIQLSTQQRGRRF